MTDGAQWAADFGVARSRQDVAERTERVYREEVRGKFWRCCGFTIVVALLHLWVEILDAKKAT